MDADLTKREAILREIAKELATRDIDAIDLRKITVVVLMRQGERADDRPRAVLSNLEYGRDAIDQVRTGLREE